MIDAPHLPKPRDGPAPRWFHVAVAASMATSALAALAGTLITGRAMNELVEQNAKLVRAGSTPMLEFGHGNVRDDGTAELLFTVTNVGSGLARVHWFELSVDGVPVRDMHAAIERISPALPQRPSIVTAPVAPRFFAAGTGERVFAWHQPGAQDAVQSEAWRAMDKARFTRITVQACYCSVFDECWLSRMDGAAPKATPNCTADKRRSLSG